MRLLLPRTGVGGGFMPRQRGGRSLELGLRALELDYEGTTAPPLASYRVRDGGHRPFVSMIDAWVRDLVPPDALVELPPARMFLAGRSVPEAFISSDLTGAHRWVPGAVAHRVAAEAAARVADGGAAGWLAPSASAQLAGADLETASIHQHGPTFHRLLMEPFLAKLRPAGGRDVAAELRRKLWVPLFWPVTVAEAFGGERPAFRPHRPAVVVREGGGIGPVVVALLARLRRRGVHVHQHDGVRALAPSGSAVAITLADGTDLLATRPVLALSAGELFGALDIDYRPARVRSVIAWVAAREDDVRETPGFVHVVDADVPAYRVTPAPADDSGTRVFCVELAHDVAEGAAAEVAAAVVTRLGLVREGTQLVDVAVFAGPTFADPTADTLRAHRAAAEQLAGLELPAAVLGGALAFGSDTFNEQVVQGLHVAATW
ncbi:hypothetical protein [Modestobacter sp. Leaf380]|uniref:hypothetical protein n=1 Tax=Modestobacter sp. Leaf380 TaxID=1736356 RepID=UPI0012F906EB|nr:hypothetical protein [Modestobacter sp. Leaf380]